MLTSPRNSLPIACGLFFKSLLCVFLVTVLTLPTLGKEGEAKPSKDRAAPSRPQQKGATKDAALSPGGPGGGRVDRFISHLKSLNLSADQQKKIEAIRKATGTKLEKLRGDKDTKAQGFREKAESILIAARQQVIEVLTPAQRRAFFMQKKNRAKEPTPPSGKKGKKKTPQIDLVSIFRGTHSISPDAETFRLLNQTVPPQPDPKAGASGQKLVFPFEQSDKNIPRTKLDQLVLKQLKKQDLEPSPLCSDQVFIRRVYLDMLGVLPTVNETLTFLQDKRAGKRARLIDSLFDRPEFADYGAMKWCDLFRVKAEFPINLWPNGAAAYHRWIREAVQENMPYDRFARELLTSSGSNFRDPPINFYRATQQRDATSLAEAVALTLMGTRLADWPKGRRDEIELFFTCVGFKKTDEWKEEIVYWDSKPPARFEATLPDGQHVTIGADQDPREAFADWLITPENPWFARNMANRVWFWLLGRGIVHQPDDFRKDNPPSNPELLDYLAKQLVDSKYDLRRLFRLILTSRTYQRSSIPHSDNPRAEALFAYYPARPMDAEVLQDAFCQIFGAEVGYMSDIPEPFTYVPKRRSTVSLADGSISSSFLQLFGRPARDTGLAAERETSVTRAQRMFFINSTNLNTWIPRSRMVRMVSPLLHDRQRRPKAIQVLWLTILSRYPTPEEMAQIDQLLESGGKKPDTFQDIVWALVNTKEFWCRH